MTPQEADGSLCPGSHVSPQTQTRQAQACLEASRVPSLRLCEPLVAARGNPGNPGAQQSQGRDRSLGPEDWPDNLLSAEAAAASPHRKTVTPASLPQGGGACAGFWGPSFTPSAWRLVGGVRRAPWTWLRTHAP